MNNIESVNAHDAAKISRAIVWAMQGIQAGNNVAALDDLDHALWLLGTTKAQIEVALEELEESEL